MPPGRRVVLITEHVHEAGLAILRARPDLHLIHAHPGDPGFPDAMAVAHGIGVRVARLDADCLARAPALRIVSKHGVGTDAIDVGWCTAHGIPVTVTPDANTISVAEHTLMLMLATARRLSAYDQAVRAGGWAIRDTLQSTELAGRTVLVVGFGRIGQRVARLCDAFGMRVEVASRSPCRDYRWWADLDAALPGADVVTLHLPRAPGTAGLFDAARIARMRRGAILINCARGGIVDEAALAAALASGQVGAAGVDVLAEEPMRRDHPLATLPNVLLTPHSAASTDEGARRMGVTMAENLLAGLDGRLDPAMVVNPAVLGRSVPG